MPNQENVENKRKAGLISLLKGYWLLIFLLIVLTAVSNGLNLIIPKIIAGAIDAFTLGTFVLANYLGEFAAISIAIFLLTYLQSIVQIYASERVARNLRAKLAVKVSQQSFSYVEGVTASKLLTFFTSDVDGVKFFVAHAISSIIASVFLIIGASTLLIMTNWQLGLMVLAIVPVVAVVFGVTFMKVKVLFKKAQEAIDWLNKIINESILGAALIRIINSEKQETEKFLSANSNANEIGLKILRLFASLIPTITLATNLATLTILTFGGYQVIQGGLTIGDFAAFNSYLSILIFPILMIGFMSNVIAQASASYDRISGVLEAEEIPETGTLESELRGDVEFNNVTLKLGEKEVLKNVSFQVQANSKVAIIGPTAAGKTQLLYLLVGLFKPSEGEIKYDGQILENYKKDGLLKQIGLVFQDSIIFNLSLRENIAFSKAVSQEALDKAIETAELKDLIDSLPDKLETMVSERGTNFSGGQKQRIMLARALALNPKILILDDFTARVDINTERKILENVRKNYPEITLISVTQKVASVEDYDQIILLMEGEKLASGRHQDLLRQSPEYAQIYNSQQSTNHI